MQMLGNFLVVIRLAAHRAMP